jgi:hypothetical protein
MTENKLQAAIKVGKEIFTDLSLGAGGYFAAIQFNFIEEAKHMITPLLTTIACAAVAHYFRKFLKWFDLRVKQFIENRKKKNEGIRK